MTDTEIKEKLCYYDERNPDGHYSYVNKQDEKIEKPIDCHCDNCFYGRTKLAEELLKEREYINSLQCGGLITILDK